MISLEEYDILDIVKILKAASEFSLQELINHLQSFLIENKTNWLEQNFSLIYQTSFENDSFLKLQEFCSNVAANEPDKIFNSSDFTSIPEKSLITLIQNDNLQMNDAQIWECVLKWGFAQNSELPSELTNFSKEDFKALKRILQQCIPFIKFNNLSSKEFKDKVLPFKKILPKELYEELLDTFLSLSDPDKRPSNKTNKGINLSNIDSKIITFQHAELIYKWIERLEVTDRIRNSYEFKLLFRGSRDGATKEKFHEICDNQSRTVTIVKVKDSNEILGGYNPIKWKSDASWGITKDSFIFSFKNNEGIGDYILSRVKDENEAVCNKRYIGPKFGKGDFRIWGYYNNGCSCKRNSYEKHIRETNDNFLVEECEVFQVVQKV